MSEKVQECAEAVRFTPHERVKERTKHGVDVLVLSDLEEIADVVRFPVEAPRLQFIDAVGEIPAVVQMQITMQDQFRANSRRNSGPCLWQG